MLALGSLLATSVSQDHSRHNVVRLIGSDTAYGQVNCRAPRRRAEVGVSTRLAPQSVPLSHLERA